MRIVKKVVDDGYSSKEAANQENIDDGMIRRWVRTYLEKGEDALQNQRKPGNPLVKYSRKKEVVVMTSMELVGFNTKWYRYKNNLTQEDMQIRQNLKWLILVL